MKHMLAIAIGTEMSAQGIIVTGCPILKIWNAAIRVDIEKNRYALGVLSCSIMFHPFRNLADVYDKNISWWKSYDHRTLPLLSNTQIVQVLRNMQN